MVEPPATVGWVSVQLLYMMSRTIFSSALELHALKPWLVRPAKESYCTVTGWDSQVKRVSTTRSSRSEPMRAETASLVCVVFIQFQRHAHALVWLSCPLDSGVLFVSLRLSLAPGVQCQRPASPEIAVSKNETLSWMIPMESHDPILHQSAFPPVSHQH